MKAFIGIIWLFFYIQHSSKIGVQKKANLNKVKLAFIFNISQLKRTKSLKPYSSNVFYEAYKLLRFTLITSW